MVNRTLRVSPLSALVSLLSCATAPPAGSSGVCNAPGFAYVDFDELVLNLPRYAGADIILDGYVKAGPKRCKDGGACDCSAQPLLHDGYPRDVATNDFLLAPGDNGTLFACQPNAACQMSCTPGPTTVVRVAGTLSPVVEGEAVLTVFKACQL